VIPLPTLRFSGDYTLGPESEEIGCPCPACRHRLQPGHRVALVWLGPAHAVTAHFFCVRPERLPDAWQPRYFDDVEPEDTFDYERAPRRVTT